MRDLDFWRIAPTTTCTMYPRYCAPYLLFTPHRGAAHGHRLSQDQTGLRLVRLCSHLNRGAVRREMHVHKTPPNILWTLFWINAISQDGRGRRAFERGGAGIYTSKWRNFALDGGRRSRSKYDGPAPRGRAHRCILRHMQERGRFLLGKPLCQGAVPCKK